MKILFLQLKLNIKNNSILRRWFRKPNTDMCFLNYYSNTEWKVKRANIINTMKSIKSINNTAKGEEEDFNELERILKLNGYPNKIFFHLKRSILLDCNRTANSAAPQDPTSILSKPNTQAKHSKEVDPISFLKKITKIEDFEKTIVNNIHDVPDDGHCMLHCISEATGVRIQKLIASIKLNSQNKKFTPFLTPNAKEDLMKFLDNRIWNSNTCDVIPSIIADALNLNITIFKKANGKVICEEYLADPNSLHRNPNTPNPTLTGKVTRKLDFRTGWFNTPTPLKQADPKPLSSINDFGNRVTLYLSGNHYNYITDVEKVNFSNNLVVETDNHAPCRMKFEYLPTLSLPFINQRITHDIMNLQSSIFPNKPFRMVFDSTAKISSLIKPLKSKKQNTKLEETDLKATGTVYKLLCKKCEQNNNISTYIGETMRPLGIRVKEHLALIKNDIDLKNKELSASAFQIHAYKDHGKLEPTDISVEILRHERRTQQRKIIEAIEIAKHLPTLNMNKGATMII